eukprot:m.191750 g.191750  ORF g.191750 m.191750 type:complete len:1036 (+) comp15153_c0_seq1:164-3271(+)
MSWKPLKLDAVPRKRSSLGKVIHGEAVFAENETCVGTNLFAESKELKSVVLPESITGIRSKSFSHCTNLTKFKMSPNITFIGDGAFYGCSGLTSIDIPHGVRTIGTEAFKNCIGLTAVVLPSTVVVVGDGAFMNCAHLIVAVIPHPATTFPLGAIQSQKKKKAPIFDSPKKPSLFGKKSGQLEPEPSSKSDSPPPAAEPAPSAPEPAPRAPAVFAGCQRLLWVIAPALLGRPDQHFKDTPFIVSQGLVDDTPDTRRRAAALHFWSPEIHHLCTAWQQHWLREFFCVGRRLGWPSGVCLAIAKSIRTSDVPQSHAPTRNPFFSKKVKATQSNHSSPSMTFSERMKAAAANKIETHVAAQKRDVPGWTTDLTSQQSFAVHIPETVPLVQERSFYSFKQLVSITVPGNVKIIENGAFQSCANLTTVTLEEGVLELHRMAFYKCESLESVTLPSSLKVIGERAFKKCSNLRSIVIPHGVKVLNAQVFADNSRLESISIPSTVTAIELSAFFSCEALVSVELPQGITSIGVSAFHNCVHLSSIEIPPGVTVIESYCFCRCSNLRSISLPHGVANIGARAFLECTNLKSFDLPSELSEIGSQAFDGCSQLSQLQMPSRLRFIGPGAFRGCTKLRSVEFPASVLMSKVSAEAFKGCTSLFSIDLPPNIEIIEKAAFMDCNSLVRIGFPGETIHICSNAFSGCTSLTSALLPSTVETLEEGAFSSCERLIVASIPKPTVTFRRRTVNRGFGFNLNGAAPLLTSNPTTELANVFSGCRRLQYVIAPSAVSGDSTFLKYLNIPVLHNGGLVADTPSTRHRASELTFWSILTHPLFSPRQREAACVVLLCAERLSSRGLHLPPEMWIAILACLRIYELGTPERGVSSAGSTLFKLRKHGRQNLKFIGSTVRFQKEPVSTRQDASSLWKNSRPSDTAGTKEGDKATPAKSMFAPRSASTKDGDAAAAPKRAFAPREKPSSPPRRIIGSAGNTDKKAFNGKTGMFGAARNASDGVAKGSLWDTSSRSKGGSVFGEKSIFGKKSVFRRE